MSSYTALPLGHSGNPSLDNFDTAYQPRRESQSHGSHSRSHSRSHSEARGGPNDFSDDIALIEREKNHNHMEDLYDPHTRTGRPSISHSQSSPQLGPEIRVHTPGIQPLTLTKGGFPDQQPMPTRLRAGGGSPSGFAKFLARFRFILIVLTLGGALLVVGANAQIYVSYAKHKGANKWMDVAGGGARQSWDAWPVDGIDLKPISVYVGVGAFNALVFIAFFIASGKKGFRYLQGLFAQILVILLTLLLFSAWLVVSILFQFQNMSHSGKHSFRTWACTHTDTRLFAVDGINWVSMCLNSNISRWTGMALVILNGLILLTALLSCCTRSKGYSRVGGPGSPPRQRGGSMSNRKKTVISRILGIFLRRANN